VNWGSRRFLNGTRQKSSLYQDTMGKSEQEANQWLDELTVEHRYLVDVWGI
jgi:hypothetical protein